MCTAVLNPARTRSWRKWRGGCIQTRAVRPALLASAELVLSVQAPELRSIHHNSQPVHPSDAAVVHTHTTCIPFRPVQRRLVGQRLWSWRLASSDYDAAEARLLPKKRPTVVGEMLLTMPWRSAWSASSRGVQASTGRPAARGEVQARLMIWTICSAEKVAGVPERGASANTLTPIWRSTHQSASAAANWLSAPTQRLRQMRIVKREQPSRVASGPTRCSAAMPKTIRTRRARACEQVAWRWSASKTDKGFSISCTSRALC